jgi:formimidoylglutamase
MRVAPRDRQRSWAGRVRPTPMVVRLVGVPWDATTLGRKGARLAPEAIRRELARLHAFDAEGGHPVSWLAGRDLTLSDDHAQMVRLVSQAADQEAALDPEAPLVLLGGDHAIAFAGARAVAARFPDLKVVSLDAHLDLRDEDAGPSNGNWATRWLKEPGASLSVLGLGRFSNDAELFERARARGVPWVGARTLREEGVAKTLRAVELRPLRDADLYVTLDMDVVEQSSAPGVSSPAPDGLPPDLVRDLVENLCRLGHVRGFDISEVNPTVDPVGVTPRLAAHLLLTLLATTGR